MFQYLGGANLTCDVNRFSGRILEVPPRQLRVIPKDETADLINGLDGEQVLLFTDSWCPGSWYRTLDIVSFEIYLEKPQD